MRKILSLAFITILAFLLSSTPCYPPLVFADKDKDKGDRQSDDQGQDKDQGKHTGKDKDENNPSPNPAPKGKEGRLRTFLKPYTNKKSNHDKNDEQDSESSAYYDSGYKDSGNNDGWDIFWQFFFADHSYRYSGYPYNDPNQHGIYIIQQSSYPDNYDELAVQLRSYYQKVSPDIWSYSVYGKLLLPAGSTLDTYYTRFAENLRPGTDHMSYFSMHFNVAGFISNRNLVLEMGWGVGELTDADSHTMDSLSLQTSIDYFPVKPWSIHLSAAYSAPAEHTLYNLDASIGWHAGPLEIFAGYHSFSNSGGETLNGPTFGAALWF